MEAASYTLKCPVFFVGFMGAGKTTLTRKLARQLGLASVDIDRCIERDQGCTIKELFGKVSEEQFRAMEASMLRHFAGLEPQLISCGGGLVCGEESRRILAEMGFTVYLYVSPDESAERISNHETRPFFESMSSVRSVNAQRVPLYEGIADYTVDTTNRMPPSVAAEVIEALQKEGVLCQAPR